MAFLGNTPTTQSFVPAVDYFNGNGSTTAFTLSKTLASSSQVEAVIENVPQNPSTAFTVSGNTITFTSAPPTGTNNIYVRYVTVNSQVIIPSPATVGVAQLNPSNMFYVNNNTLSVSYIVPAGVNAMCAGPLTINTGVTLTVSTGSRLVVV
jgi:hypothetical protein